MKYQEIKEAGNYSSGDGAGSSHPDAPSQALNAALLPDQQLALDKSLYRQYHNASKMAGATPMEFKEWLGNKHKKETMSESVTEAGMGFSSQGEAVAHAEEKLRDIQQELEREVEWVLTDYLDPNAVKKMLQPVHAGISSAINSLSTVEGQTESVDPAVARIVELSGLGSTLGGIANKTTFAGTPVAEAGAGLGLAHQRVLDQGYAECETQIMRAVGMIKRYAAKVNSMSADMNDDEQAHYSYSIRGLLDVIEDEVKDLQKLG